MDEADQRIRNYSRRRGLELGRHLRNAAGDQRRRHERGPHRRQGERRCKGLEDLLNSAQRLDDGEATKRRLGEAHLLTHGGQAAARLHHVQGRRHANV